MRNKSWHPLISAICTAILLSLAWYPGLAPLIFVAWIPLLLAAEGLIREQARSIRLLGISYIAFLIWNVAVTWWVTYASLPGALLAFVLNSLLMALVFCLAAFVRRRTGSPDSWFILIPLWMGFEYLHGIWKLTWTWLNLGNVFSYAHQLVQWFEYTGVSGGTLWTLLVNILIFRAVLKGRFQLRTTSGIIAALVIPALFSYLILSRPLPSPASYQKVMLVQPNLDPYKEEFEAGFEAHFSKAEALISGRLDSTFSYLVFPETFISSSVNEDELAGSSNIRLFIDRLLLRFPKLTVITGASTYKLYGSEKLTSSARQDSRNGTYYDFFNTAIQIDSGRFDLYHKSKLVPGVEWLPGIFGALAIDLGGTVGSLGTQEERTIFTSAAKQTSVAPVICYESVYADYVNRYIRSGAQAIFIITNDGWWDDTPGYRQHLNYARLRAIENRRAIARCANTGVSCFIDERGELSQETPFWETAVITAEVPMRNEHTFFTRHGDILSYISCLILGAVLGFRITVWFTALFKRIGQRV